MRERRCGRSGSARLVNAFNPHPLTPPSPEPPPTTLLWSSRGGLVLVMHVVHIHSQNANVRLYISLLVVLRGVRCCSERAVVRKVTLEERHERCRSPRYIPVLSTLSLHSFVCCRLHVSVGVRSWTLAWVRSNHQAKYVCPKVNY